MIAAYLRVSSDKQDVARQRQSIIEWAARHGHAIAHWFEDAEGRNPRDKAAKRVEFQKLLKSVESGLVRKIIVDSQDRFGTRDAYELGKFLTLLRENDCELWSVNQGHLTADDDATILTNTIGALTSTREQKEKAARNLSGKVKKAKAGEYQGGYPPYGCDVACFNGREKWRVEWAGHFERWKVYPDGTREAFNGKDNFPAKDANDTLRYRPTLNADRLAVVQNIFDWYASEDISPGKIATRLNKLGIMTTVGTPWNKVVVKQLLANPVYIGMPAWNKRGGSRFKEYVDGQIQDVSSKVLGRVRSREDFVQPEKPEFEPIIDADTWGKVQAKLAAAKSGKRSPAQVDELWLKPFLFCGVCGKPMRANGRQPRLKPGYFCGTYGTYGKDNPTGCKCHRVQHTIIEALVEKYLDEVSPAVAELAECEDSGLFDVAYREWSDTVSHRNSLWVKMAATINEWPEDYWNIEKAYQPAKRPEIEAEIESKECQLEEMLGGFFKLTPIMQERANKRMESIQIEIDHLRGEVEDLSAPWREVQNELYRRQQALQHAASIADETGPRRAEALRKVVDRIVCHFRPNGQRTIIDAVEIFPVSAESACFTEVITSGRG